MTAVDFLIVGIVCAGLMLFLKHRKALSDAGLTLAFISIVVGLGATGMFHVADIGSMWVLPLIIPRPDAMQIMTTLHLNFRWGVAVVGVVAIVTGFGVVLSALLRSEARSRDFAESASDGFWEMDFDLRYTNVRGVIMEGLREEGQDPIGKTRWEYIGVNPSTDEHWRKHKEDLEAHRPFRDFEYSYVNSRGRHHRRVNGKPFFDANGSFTGYRGIVENRTAAVEAESKARRVQERLEYAVNQMPIGIVLYDEEDRLVMRNHADRSISPNTSQVRPGTRFEDIVRTGITAGLVSDAIGREEEYVQERLERHRNPTQSFEQVVQGRRIEIQEHKLPDGGTIVFHTDVTEKRQAEEVLHATEARLAAMLEIAPDGVIALDHDQKIQVFNRGAEEIFGYEAHEVIGLSVEILLPKDKYEIHREHLKMFAASSHNRRLASKRGEISGRRKDGTLFSAEGSIAKLEIRGETVLMVTLRDITERTRAEQALLKAKEKAEIANRTKSEFLANMSHELRTPLNAISGFSQVMQSGLGGPLTEKQREYLSDIQDSGDHLLALINDILDLSKVELGELEVDDELVDLAGCIIASVRMFNERKHEARLEIATNGLIDLPLIRGDSRKIRQILLNLLSNAFKFTSRGDEIAVSAGVTNDGAVYFEVVDTGIGMSPDEVNVALTLFGQVESGLDRNYDGSGLGLPLCKSLAEAHGGALEIESESGTGTKVRVIFPPERVVANTTVTVEQVRQA